MSEIPKDVIVGRRVFFAADPVLVIVKRIVRNHCTIVQIRGQNERFRQSPVHHSLRFRFGDPVILNANSCEKHQRATIMKFEYLIDSVLIWEISVQIYIVCVVPSYVTAFIT